MPITLNGSGSINGLNPDGLPDSCVTTNDLADGAVTPAKLSQPLTLATAKAYNWNGATTNTFIDFTGIPSWVKRVTVMLQGVSLSGSSHILFQLGTSGGVESSGYNSSGTFLSQGGAGSGSSTAGMFLYSGSTTNVLSGAAVFARVTGNSWLATGMFTLDNVTGYTFGTAGSKTLSGALDRIRITTLNGTDTFDAGSINIMYE